MIDLSIIIVNWNTKELLAQCLRAIYDTVSNHRFEIIVVDNGSRDGSQGMVRDLFPQVRLIENRENAGFVRANNQGLDASQGRYILLLNSDTRVLSDSLDGMVRFMDAYPTAGVAGVRLLNPDGSFQASYTPFPNLWQEFLILSRLGRWLIRPAYPSRGPEIERGTQRIRGYVEGACLMVRRESVDYVGGLDERIFMYSEEVDWCYRFDQAGWEIWYLPDAPVIHHGGQSSGQRGSRMEAELYRGRVYFFQKHRGRGAALGLKALIYATTLLKIVVHGGLRLVTRGQRGRNVTNWRELNRALTGGESALLERGGS